MLPSYSVYVVLAAQIAVFFYLKPWQIRYRLVAEYVCTDMGVCYIGRYWRLKREIKAYRLAGML